MPTVKKSVHKNATRSRHLIKTAFAELLNEKDINKITVTDIVERANISRGTFYAHYLDVFDLYSAIQHNVIEALDDLFNELGVMQIVADPSEAIMRGVLFLNQNKSYYKLFAVSSHAELLLERIKKIIVEKMTAELITCFSAEDTTIIKCHVLYALGGIQSVMLNWFSGEIDVSGEMMAQTVSAMCLSHRPQVLVDYALTLKQTANEE